MACSTILVRSNVTQGVLSFTGGGTHTGSFASGANGWIEFAGSSTKPTHDLNAGASVTGNVRMISSFGALVVNTGATYNASKTEIVGGGKFHVADSSMTAHTGTLAVSGGDLTGPGNLAASGLTTFTGGQIGGDRRQCHCQWRVEHLGCRRQNAGAFRWLRIERHNQQWLRAHGAARATSAIGAVARLTNSAGASLDIQSDADFNNGTFINQGTLTKSAGATRRLRQRTTISGLFNNSGSVNVTQGVLSFTGGGTHTGSFASGANGWIEFAGSSTKPTHDLNAGASVNGQRAHDQ